MTRRRSTNSGGPGHGLVALLVAAFLTAGCSGGGDDSISDAESTVATTVAEATTTTTLSPDDSLPPLAVPSADVQLWLAGDGAVFVEVRRIARDVLAATDNLTTAQCAAWVAELVSGPTPELLVESAATAPDPVLGDALGGTTIALNRVLSRCATGEPVDPESVEELRAQLALVDEREASL